MFRNRLNLRNVVAVAICLAGVTTTLAAGKILPTVAYSDENKLKTEYTYDNFGHIISRIDRYQLPDGTYNLLATTLTEYWQLPNGEFVKTKETATDEHGKLIAKMETTYDNKGMELMSKYENNMGISDWSETILNAEGIRTGLKQWNGTALETVPDIVFDSKGRIIQWQMGDKLATYTWGEGLNDFLSANMNGITVNNIVPVKNLEYFDPYSLAPLDNGGDDKNDSQFAWEDYHFHKMYANMDVVYQGKTGKLECTITDNVWTQKITLGTTVVQENVLTKLANGGWEEVDTYAPEFLTDPSYPTKHKKIREYDQYGFLTRYLYEDRRNNGEIAYSSEEKYEREYDSQNRPVKTTHYRGNNPDPVDVETYTAWTNVGSGINTPAVAPLTIYPTMTDGIVNINNPDNKTVYLHSISGARLLETQAQRIDLSTYPKGLYIIKIDTRTAKVIRK